MDAQMRLFPERYLRCQNCGRDVSEIRMARRFRLCLECYEQIVPDPETIIEDGDPRMEAFWSWYAGMEKRYPTNRVYGTVRRLAPRQWIEFLPTCPVCGRERVETNWGMDRSLFGAPRQCRYCENEGLVDSAFRLHYIHHPDWDDESWLDWLYVNFKEAFTLGILPQRWFDLSRGVE